MAILDDLSSTSSVEMAFSMSRYLLASYSGPIVKLRDSLSAEADFYPDGSGGIETASNQAPDVWGTGPFAVVRWYDQSGAANDFVATIVDSALDTTTQASGIPGIDMTSATTIPGVTADFFTDNSSSYIYSMVVAPKGATISSSSKGINYDNLTTWRASLEQATTSTARFDWQRDFTDVLTGTTTFGDSEVAIANAYSAYNAGHEAFIGTVSQGQLANVGMDHRSFQWQIVGLATYVFYEFVLIVEPTTATIPASDRTTLVENQQAYYEAFDYTPPPAASGGEQKQSLGLALGLL